MSWCEGRRPERGALHVSHACSAYDVLGASAQSRKPRFLELEEGCTVALQASVMPDAGAARDHACPNALQRPAAADDRSATAGALKPWAHVSMILSCDTTNAMCNASTATPRPRAVPFLAPKGEKCRRRARVCSNAAPHIIVLRLTCTMREHSCRAQTRPEQPQHGSMHVERRLCRPMLALGHARFWPRHCSRITGSCRP